MSPRRWMQQQQQGQKEKGVGTCSPSINQRKNGDGDGEEDEDDVEDAAPTSIWEDVEAQARQEALFLLQQRRRMALLLSPSSSTSVAGAGGERGGRNMASGGGGGAMEHGQQHKKGGLTKAARSQEKEDRDNSLTAAACKSTHGGGKNARKRSRQGLKRPSMGGTLAPLGHGGRPGKRPRHTLEGELQGEDAMSEEKSVYHRTPGVKEAEGGRVEKKEKEEEEEEEEGEWDGSLGPAESKASEGGVGEEGKVERNRRSVDWGEVEARARKEAKMLLERRKEAAAKEDIKRKEKRVGKEGEHRSLKLAQKHEPQIEAKGQQQQQQQQQEQETGNAIGGTGKATSSSSSIGSKVSPALATIRTPDTERTQPRGSGHDKEGPLLTAERGGGVDEKLFLVNDGTELGSILCSPVSTVTGRSGVEGTQQGLEERGGAVTAETACPPHQSGQTVARSRAQGWSCGSKSSGGGSKRRLVGPLRIPAQEPPRPSREVLDKLHLSAAVATAGGAFSHQDVAGGMAGLFPPPYHTPPRQARGESAGTMEEGEDEKEEEGDEEDRRRSFGAPGVAAAAIAAAAAAATPEGRVVWKRGKKPRRRRQFVFVEEVSDDEADKSEMSRWSALEEKAKQTAKAILAMRQAEERQQAAAVVAAGTAASIANESSLMTEDRHLEDNSRGIHSGGGCSPWQKWVRRSERAAGTTMLDSSVVQQMLCMIRNNHPDVVVLKLHHWLGPDTNSTVIDEVLEALAVNTNCEALYIQNFNEGFRTRQLEKLAKVLARGHIWCLNAGENYNIALGEWWSFARLLEGTNVTHAYLSEHVLTPELKTEVRAIIRANRKKHTRHRSADNWSVIERCTNCWWNPSNCSALQKELRARGIVVRGHQQEQGQRQGQQEEPGHRQRDYALKSPGAVRDAVFSSVTRTTCQPSPQRSPSSATFEATAAENDDDASPRSLRLHEPCSLHSHRVVKNL